MIANDEIFFQYEMHQRHLATGCHLILQTSDTTKKKIPLDLHVGSLKWPNKDWTYKNSSGKTPVGKKKYAIFSNDDFFYSLQQGNLLRVLSTSRMRLDLRYQGPKHFLWQQFQYIFFFKTTWNKQIKLIDRLERLGLCSHSGNNFCKNLQFWSILLCYKKCFAEKRTYRISLNNVRGN